ncbi:hypothetical protein [Okeania sp. KiyG1]|uniref:hypothetical protein n=1 Tax=Okeania sp. KiyG1 TaxID=2720165 RepID=UPI0019232A5A|nr:hypothetical protein [Okeania sp. KiyG1]GGA21733.1 hypothetical protein CYANOKiyG1_36740 [Okeania sp. KiyG1]
MGEELIKIFNQVSVVTSGKHFTPEEIQEMSAKRKNILISSDEQKKLHRIDVIYYIIGIQLLAVNFILRNVAIANNKNEYRLPRLADIFAFNVTFNSCSISQY